MASKMYCPICKKVLPITDSSHDECQDCLQDYNNGEYKIKLPDGLEHGLTCFGDYMRIGELIYDLKINLLSRKEFEEKMAKLVKEINTAAKMSRRPKTEEQKRDTAYAESFYIRR